jgi:hypothetical protein
MRKHVEFELTLSFMQDVLGEDPLPDAERLVGVTPTWDSRTSKHDRDGDAWDHLRWKLSDTGLALSLAAAKRLQKRFPDKAKILLVRKSVMPDYTFRSGGTVFCTDPFDLGAERS